ncbi:hypothetical protein THAOC_04990, partial [Thalassiosira oceanica]
LQQPDLLNPCPVWFSSPFLVWIHLSPLPNASVIYNAQVFVMGITSVDKLVGASVILADSTPTIIILLVQHQSNTFVPWLPSLSLSLSLSSIIDFPAV